MDPTGWALPLKRNQGLLVFMIRYWNHFDPYGSYILHGTETGTGKQYVSKLRCVHPTQGQGQVHGSIVLYCAHPVPCPCPCPCLGPVQCV